MTPEEELELIRIRARARARARQQQAEQPQSPPPPPRVSTGEDVARSFGTGVVRGTGALAGMQGDIYNMAQQGIEGLGRRLGLDERTARGVGQVFATGVSPVAGGGVAGARMVARPEQRESIQAPGAVEATSAIDSVIPGEPWQPQTTAGEYARTIGEFTPGALLPAGAPRAATMLGRVAPVTRTARAVVPAVASESAGQLTEGTSFEVPARIAGALIGGVGTELSVGAAAARSARTPTAIVPDSEFGPRTRGERAAITPTRGGEPPLDDLAREADIRMGMESGQAQNQMLGFDFRRAQQIRDNAVRLIVARGGAPNTQNAAEAGATLADEIRSLRQFGRELRDRRYAEAFDALRNDPIQPATPTNMSASDTIRTAIDGQFPADNVPSSVWRQIRWLDEEIAAGRATHATVERVRQELNRELGTAINQMDGAAEFRINAVIGALDDWRSSLVTNPNSQRLIRDARRAHQEVQALFGEEARPALSSGHTGDRDLGGRTLERIAGTELTGDQILNQIFGNDGRPTQSALATVRRIKQIGTRRIVYSNTQSPSGVRTRGRVSMQEGEGLDMRTRASRRFMADSPESDAAQRYFGGQAQKPENELQALREGFLYRLLQPLDDYISRAETEGAARAGLLPARRLANNLDRALGPGRQITEELLTPAEIGRLEALQRYLQGIAPPPGSFPVSSPAATRAARGVGKTIMDFVLPFGIGPFVRSGLEQAGAENFARQAVAQPLPRQRLGSPLTAYSQQPSNLNAARAGVVGAMSAEQREQEKRRRLGAQ